MEVAQIHEEMETRFMGLMERAKKKGQVGALAQFLSDDVVKFALSTNGITKLPNFNYIVLFYEQTLAEFPKQTNIWRSYHNLAHLHHKQSVLKLYQRSLKHCNSTSEFWIGYLQEMERVGELTNGFEQV